MGVCVVCVGGGAGIKLLQRVLGSQLLTQARVLAHSVHSRSSLWLLCLRIVLLRTVGR